MPDPYGWSGPPLLTVPRNTLTAKGSLFVATAAGVVTELPIGSNGDLLWADSAQTPGLAWKAPYLVFPSLTNEIKAWPPLIRNDIDLDANLHWWRKVGTPSTAPTYVDVTGESITETYRDAIKVVAAAASDGMKQTYTYADEPRLKSGRTVSALLAIWSVSSVSVTASLLNSDASSTSASAVTAAAWTIVEIPGHVLAGTSCDLKVTAAAAGTFYVVPLGLCIGNRGLWLPPRPRIHKQFDAVVANVTLDGAADPNTYTDVDVTTSSSNLACIGYLALLLNEATSLYDLWLRRKGDSGGGYLALSASSTSQNTRNMQTIVLNDAQVFEYKLDRVVGSSALDTGNIGVTAYEEWG